jgi:hypothetical protein
MARTLLEECVHYQDPSMAAVSALLARMHAMTRLVVHALHTVGGPVISRHFEQTRAACGLR